MRPGLGPVRLRACSSVEPGGAPGHIMGRNIFVFVTAPLLLCGLAKAISEAPCDGIFESVSGIYSRCGAHNWIFVGSQYYHRTLLIARSEDGCGEHYTLKTYVREPGMDFTLNTTTDVPYGTEPFAIRLTCPIGFDVRITTQSNSGCSFNPCNLRISANFLSERVPTQWNAKHLPSSTDAPDAATQICNNGGFRENSATGSCACPPGFGGPTCEDACGWDKYGDNCELACTGKPQGCKGVAFCHSNCTCAAGFKGPTCDQVCGPGLYGANCTQTCGQCKYGDVCDPVTGHCPEDCRPGYVRPFCQKYIPLRHLANAPDIHEVGSTTVKGSFPTTIDSTNGLGSVVFYQLQYKDQSKPNGDWVPSTLGRLPADFLGAETAPQNFTMLNLPPDTSLLVRVLLLDEEMHAFNFPPAVEVRTSGRRRVEKLKVTNVSARGANLTWESYDFTQGDYFFVRHECLSLVACPGACPHPDGIMSVASPSVSLERLLPAAKYRVTVEAADNHKEAVTFTTGFLLPDASVSSLRVSARTNSSALVEWGPSDQCEWVFGPTAQYAWSLQPLGSKAGTATAANTTATSTVLTGLQPLANYQFSVNLFNTEGESPARRTATLNFSTYHTVPDPPRDLTVYRLNRTAVWLRWREPSRPSGTLRAYIIETTPVKEKGDASRGPPRLLRSERLPVGSHCEAWPDLVCYTVSRLRPRSRYTITVSAVNEHGDKPGEPSSVEASTVKGVSEPPQDFRVLSRDKTSALVAWRMPNKINGDLTSFEVAVARQVRADEESAETDVPDPDLERILVTKEQPQYEYRVEGLQPGATYAVTVNCGHGGRVAHLEVTTDEEDEAA
ncbi:tenascin-like [Thrips palmi]|uniref:Tenascin-like n=1 Tax=Thrips palmi TaxID=161013 RepID=A0A6P8YT08_THRPL|nr:tenascin-like [Thrips palmi]